MKAKTKMEVFESAFRDGAGSCRIDCACGKIHYCPSGPATWEPGELEALEKDENAFALEWGPSYLSFEGRTFSMDCDCWKDRAKQVMNFLDAHRFKIADYFKLEKERKAAEAEDAPEVKL